MEIDFILLFLGIMFSFVLNFLFNKSFLKINRLDEMNSRSSHQVEATRSGGIAIFSGLFLITLILYFLNTELYDFSILLPLGIIFIVGVYDDFYNADFKLKFFIQIIVAKLFIDQGFVISNFHGFLGLEQVPYLIGQLTTVLVFIVIVNAINFVDGIDGLAVTICLFTIVSYEILTNGNSSIFFLNIIYVGLLIPFYFFNSKKKNKVFLGDGGSLQLGTLIAINTFSFLSPDKILLNINPVIFSIIILFYPLIDLLRVFILRIRQGKSPFVADKNHLHHRLELFLQNHFSRSSLIVLLNFLLFIIVFLIELNFSSFYSLIIIIIISVLIIKIK